MQKSIPYRSKRHLHYDIFIQLRSITSLTFNIYYDTYCFQKLVQACSIGNRPIHAVPELVQACSISNEPRHMVLELVQACSIGNEPIHMDPELVQACCIGSRPIHRVQKISTGLFYWQQPHT